MRDIKEYRDTNTLIKFNSIEELKKLINERVSTVFDGWKLRDFNDDFKKYGFIDMSRDVYVSKNLDKAQRNYVEYIVIEAAEFFESFEEPEIKFHYINNAGVKTFKVAKRLSDITDLKELLYQITT